jgi:Immunoglobulin domain
MKTTFVPLFFGILFGMACMGTAAAPVNDNFAQATLLGPGNNVSSAYYETIDDATMEPGEPAHLGNVPQKSVWWEWQAPLWGDTYFILRGSASTNAVVAIYTGDSLDTLTLVAKGANSPVFVPVTGGQTYYIAGAVATNTTGDLALIEYYASQDTSAHVIPGNLLQEPSWEGTEIFNAHFWHWSGSFSGYVNQSGGVDGTTWPILSDGTTIWQDIPTIPGHSYAVKFACHGSGGAVAVWWDTNQLGVFSPAGGGSYCWQWRSFTATASNATSRVSFQGLNGGEAADAFSVVDASAPPVIVTQPISASSVGGGTATFSVGATGPSPLSYQWFFNDSPMAGQTGRQLTLNSLTAGAAGNYQVVITNAFGAVTSTVAALLVDDPGTATILSQPYGDTVPVGGYFNLSVVAAGPPPLAYQWFLNNLAIIGATNGNLMFTNIQTTNAGSYTVLVSAQSSTALSLPATLSVSTSGSGGGVIDFRNRNFFSGVTNIDARVFDLDGVTPLDGSNYVAQLYAGPSLDLLRPAGRPTPFQSGVNAGFFLPQTVTLANVAPGSNAVLQVCAWDATFGTGYEQVRFTGGKFGKSAILQVVAGGGTLPPQTLLGFQSFSLQAGLPHFQVGTISFVGMGSTNTMVWAVHGQPNCLYLIEKSDHLGGTVWQPLTVLTNVTGTVTFTDTANGTNVWYRARILD